MNKDPRTENKQIEDIFNEEEESFTDEYESHDDWKEDMLGMMFPEGQDE